MSSLSPHTSHRLQKWRTYGPLRITVPLLCCALLVIRGVQITSDETGVFDRYGWRFMLPFTSRLDSCIFTSLSFNKLRCMMHMNGIEPRLLQAVQAGRLKELKKLLATGTDVNVRSSWSGLAALHVAAINGYGGIAEMLLKHGADKDALDDTGETPLMKAAVEGHQPVVELLLKAGADIDIAGKSESNRAASCFYGSGALQYAVAAGHDGIVRTLLKHGADVNAQDDRGYTPLHCAIQVGRVGMAGTLLEAGAKTLVTDKEEQTPLVWAARQDDAV